MELTSTQIWTLIGFLVALLELLIAAVTVHLWRRRRSEKAGTLVVIAGFLYEAVVLLCVIALVVATRH